jgi:diacylglycerol kinase family enzyme
VSRRPRALFVANPVAHRVSRRSRDRAVEALGGAFDLDVRMTKAAEHATELAAGAADAGADLVIVLGGDGTLNEAVNGIGGDGEGGGVPLAVLPGGQANVVTRSLGLPRGPVRAARALALRAAGGLEAASHPMPLGRVEGRLFVANCGVGFDAAIVREAERHPDAKRAMGDWLFVYAGASVFFRGYDRRSPAIRVRHGEGPDDALDGGFLAVVQNVDPYTYLGPRPIRLCPGVRTEGGLDLLVLDSFATGAVLRVLGSALARARHPSFAHAHHRRDLSRIEVRCDRPMPVQLDGEYLGERTDLLVESVPGLLSLVY